MNGRTYLTNKVLQTFPGDTTITQEKGFRQIRIQQLHRYTEIRLVEIIINIPSNLAVLAALLDHGVEKRQHKD